MRPHGALKLGRRNVPRLSGPTPDDAALLDLPMLLHLIACWMGHGLLVVEHRAEIAHIEPAFKEVRMNRGRPMGLASQDS